MTYTFESFNPIKLALAVKQPGAFYTFSLGTSEIGDLGISDPDDHAQVFEGGRFDLSPWKKYSPWRSIGDKSPMTPREILHKASQVADYLYLQFEPSGGSNGAGDISATYNALNTPAARLVSLDPIEQPSVSRG